jgi:hypothetical protein
MGAFGARGVFWHGSQLVRLRMVDTLGGGKCAE